MSNLGQRNGCGPVRSTFADDPDYRELLEMFADSLQDTTAGLRDAKNCGDLARLQSEAHRVKGAGAGYGFEGLTTAAHSLEDACKARNSAEIERTLDELLGYIARIQI